MSNALSEAKRAANDVAMTTSVHIRLDVLQALILEAENLAAEVRRLNGLAMGMEADKVRNIKA